MSYLRKKLIALFAVLLCAMLALAAVLIYLPKSITANADYDASKFTIIGGQNNDLYDSVSKSFNGTLLSELYEKIAGSGATYDTVENLVKNDSDKAITSANIRAKNGNNNISVWFGGFKWDVTYITQARKTGNDDKDLDGNIIIDLWQSADGANSTRGTPTSGTYLQTSDCYSPKTSTTGVNYPANMYTTSSIRVVGLNAGGFYSQAANGLIPNRQSQVATDSYAHLTMASPNNGKDSLINYIVQPKNVAYQETEDTRNNYLPNSSGTSAYQAQNDAYGTITQGWYSSDYDYTGKGDESMGTSYDYWKNDYLWLPSFAETGNTDSTGNGIWETDNFLRSTVTGNAWLRSAQHSSYDSARYLKTDGGHGASIVSTSGYYVRPALHFNLTKAAFNAGGISFGTADTTISPDSSGVKTAKATHTYDGKDYELTIPDSDKLDITDINNYVTDGKFTVKLPNDSDSENYEITVTPKTGYYWGDVDSAEEGKKPRTYAIHVNKATIISNWNDFSVQYGGNLLQETGLIESKTVKDFSVDFEVEYCITHAASGTPQEPSTKNWKSEEALDTKTATATGKYRVDYKIEDVDGYHTKLESSYIVTVKSDTVTISVNGDGIVGRSEYGGAVTYLTDQEWLNTQFAQRVTLTATSGTYSGETAVKGFLQKEGLNVVLLKDSGSGKTSAIKNGYKRFDVGTYYFGLSESSSIEFKWDTNGEEKYPSYEITKKELKVYIVEESGGSLTHIYGNSPATLEYDVDDENQAFLTEINGTFSKAFTITDIIKCDSALDDYTLGNKTPVGTFMIEGSTGTNGNFTVNFDDTQYVITQRHVKLQVSDEEVPYGTDFGSHKFTLTDVDKSLPSWDKASALSAEYYLTKTDGVPVEFSDVVVGEYFLCVRVDNPNYDFEYDTGILTITTADFDMKDVKLNNAAYVYDGEAHSAQLSGTLPSEEIHVTFRYVNMADGSSSTDAPVEIGLYTVYASFTHSNPNYNAITDKAAYIRIVATEDELNQGFPTLPSEDDIAKAAELAKKKQAAKEELEKVANAKKEEIAAMEIGDEEKEKAYSEIDKELAAGNAAIDGATDESGVDQAFNEAKKKIEDIGVACKAAEELEKKKKAAKDELEQAAKDKNAEIDSNEELTDEEKAEAKKKVEEELAKGNAAIDGATDASGVESAESKSKSNIENIKGIHKEDSSFPWWIIIVIGGVLLVLALLIVIIVKRRQTADGEDEYDDYYDDEYDFDEEYDEDSFDDFDDFE